MFWLWVFTQLTRLLTVMVCWMALMGIPLLCLPRPLDAAHIHPFLGIFYVTLLVTGTWLSRSWNGGGLAFMVSPFWALFTALAWVFAWRDDAGPGVAFAFLLIFPVTWVCWQVGKRLPSAARDHGVLLAGALPPRASLQEELDKLLAQNALAGAPPRDDVPDPDPTRE